LVVFWWCSGGVLVVLPADEPIRGLSAPPVERPKPGVQMIEYRHTPDPGDIRRVTMRFLTGFADSRIYDEKEAS
jgi:hypothetical protein